MTNTTAGPGVSPTIVHARSLLVAGTATLMLMGVQFLLARSTGAEIPYLLSSWVLGVLALSIYSKASTLAAVGSTIWTAFSLAGGVMLGDITQIVASAIALASMLLFCPGWFVIAPLPVGWDAATKHLKTFSVVMLAAWTGNALMFLLLP